MSIITTNLKNIQEWVGGDPNLSNIQPRYREIYANIEEFVGVLKSL
jgi:hypothetical protein